MRYALEQVGAGDRVSLRRRLPGGGLGDVLGVVEQVSPHALSVRRSDGSLVDVDGADVVAVKRVPPPPARRRRGPDAAGGHGG